MFKTYFDSNEVLLLAAGCICFFLSLIFHLRNEQKLQVLFLVLTALFINCFAALLDPFLNLWDERFHALVAKNLMHHPLMPTLYDDPVVKTAYNSWDKYHIWIHKQPLFLWQIALSYKLFGVSEFALRLPSAISGVALVFIGYRSGKLLVNNRVGYITGVLMITSLYFIELIAGRQELDHNDFSFLTYISLSIWAWIEYCYAKKKAWIYLIGIFSGFAILCKWLAGLLIYLGWFTYLVKTEKMKFSKYKDLLMSFAVAILIALPWQILSFAWYPAEAKAAYDLNAKSFFIPVEGHGGDIWYHLNNFNLMYGKLSLLLIIPALLILYLQVRNKKMFFPLLSMIIGVYLFFSLAETKMPSFTVIVALPLFIAFASLIAYLLSYIDKLKVPAAVKNTGIFLLLSFLFFARLDVESLQAKHTLWKPENSYTQMLTENKNIFNSLKLPPGAVIFNVKGRHYIESMFYTGLPSYNFIPSEDQYIDLKNKKRIIAIFSPADGKLPDFLEKDSSVIIINMQLQGYD